MNAVKKLLLTFMTITCIATNAAAMDAGSGGGSGSGSGGGSGELSMRERLAAAHAARVARSATAGSGAHTTGSKRKSRPVSPDSDDRNTPKPPTDKKARTASKGKGKGKAKASSATSNVVYVSSDSDNDEDEAKKPSSSKAVCCICTKEVGDGDYNICTCTHATHYDCLAEWLKINPSCPTCRTPISIDTIKHKKLFEDFAVFTDLSLDEQKIFFMNAIRNENSELALMLITNGFNVNFANDAGKTPLMAASITGNKSIIKQLLKHGAPLDTTLNGAAVANNTALAFALKHNHYDVCQILHKAGATVTTEQANLFRNLTRRSLTPQTTVKNNNGDGCTIM